MMFDQFGKFISNYRTYCSRILTPTKSEMSNSVFITPEEIYAFIHLVKYDAVLSSFMKRDCCKKLCDSYLLAMIFVYFKRASFTKEMYNRENLFVALYLAQDMEEDDDLIKLDILPWALGPRWRQESSRFMAKKFNLWKKMDYRALVSLKTCKKIMSYFQDDFLDGHLRSNKVSGAYRTLLESEDVRVLGPLDSPRICNLHLLKDDSSETKIPARKRCKTRQRITKKMAEKYLEVGIRREAFVSSGYESSTDNDFQCFLDDSSDEFISKKMKKSERHGSPDILSRTCE